MFIPIHAKSDITEGEGRKKGKITPVQSAQINAWCLASKTGILDCLDKCIAKEENITNIENNEATITFGSGFLVICGRLVECEDGTKVTVRTPTTGSSSGKIIARFNLLSSGENEFQVLAKTGDLIQQDLNSKDYIKKGTYEFELYTYTATPTSLKLERTFDYIPDIESLFDKNKAVAVQRANVARDFDKTEDENGKHGLLYNTFAQIGISNYQGTKAIAPLNGYNKDNGTIEERLTKLGFKEGSISNSTSSNLASNVTLTKVGYYAILRTNQVFLLQGNEIEETFEMVLDEKPLKSLETLEVAIRCGDGHGAIKFTAGSNIVKIVKNQPYNATIYMFSVGFKIII